MSGVLVSGVLVSGVRRWLCYAQLLPYVGCYRNSDGEIGMEWSHNPTQHLHQTTFSGCHAVSKHAVSKHAVSKIDAIALMLVLFVECPIAHI